MVKHLPAMRETRVQFLGREDPWRRKWQSTPALLPGKSHGRRSLIGYSPWGCKESDTTEHHTKDMTLELGAGEARGTWSDGHNRKKRKN